MLGPLKRTENFLAALPAPSPAAAGEIEAPASAEVAPGAVADSGGDLAKRGVAQASRKEPHAKAFLAYRLWRFSGMKQIDIAGQMSKSQKTISGWVSSVKDWCETGNPLPDSEAVTRKIQSLDPAVIELGAEIEHRTPRQRHRATP